MKATCRQRAAWLALTLLAARAAGQGAAPQERAAAVEALRSSAEAERTAAWATARAGRWTPRGRHGDGWYELQAIRNGKLYVLQTENVNAAISTAANAVRNTAPYNLNGGGVTVGIWDGGGVRSTHVELTGRVTLKDGASVIDHATHVAGTIGALGASASALGMAPGVSIDSYEWTSDTAEMTARAMATSGQAGMLPLSNHSYGYSSGWETSSASGTTGPHWYGEWGARESDNFGQYDTYARAWDTVCYNAPYYLPFKSAGNDRDDGAPSAGTTFYYYSGGGWLSKAYDAATDPLADGWDNGGYDTLPLTSVAKNVLTVGSVSDAVSRGVRSLPNATMSGFSGWGPADDGRIKPDIVANGYSVYSSIGTSDSSYAYYNGTSMSGPNACGSAALLVEYYTELFGGQYPRASTLKALIIHTADDLGTSGPDYRFGWGLMNTKEAADLLKRQAELPTALHITESSVTTATASRTLTVGWDGVGPLRFTLAWTDPAGTAQTGMDTTTRNLVNNLDLRVQDPAGQTFLPYVLNRASPTNAATAGDNNIDNVEQVYIAAPSAVGAYTVTVSRDGTLSSGTQNYSLIMSGTAPYTVYLTVTGTPRRLGSVSPAYGTHAYVGGQSVTGVTDGVHTELSPGTRLTHRCTGWSGTGSVPASGTGLTTGAFRITNDSVLAWSWVLADVALSNQTVSVTTNYTARDSVTAGEAYRVNSGGNVTFQTSPGGAVRLTPGFTAASGSVFRARSQ